MSYEDILDEEPQSREEAYLKYIAENMGDIEPLPPVTKEDDGKVLRVEDGKWVPGESPVFVITATEKTLTDDNDKTQTYSYTVDKTADEIVGAIDAEKVCVLVDTESHNVTYLTSLKRLNDRGMFEYYLFGSRVMAENNFDRKWEYSVGIYNDGAGGTERWLDVESRCTRTGVVTRSIPGGVLQIFGTTSYDPLPVSDKPTADSPFFITSGAVYEALQNAGGSIPTITLAMDQIISMDPMLLQLSEEQYDILLNNHVVTIDATEFGFNAFVALKVYFDEDESQFHFWSANYSPSSLGFAWICSEDVPGVIGMGSVDADTVLNNEIYNNFVYEPEFFGYISVDGVHLSAVDIEKLHNIQSSEGVNF